MLGYFGITVFHRTTRSLTSYLIVLHAYTHWGLGKGGGESGETSVKYVPPEVLSNVESAQNAEKSRGGCN